MEENMIYKAESDSTITYKEIKRAISGPDRILNEVIKYTNPVMKLMINSYMKIFNVILN